MSRSRKIITNLLRPKSLCTLFGVSAVVNSDFTVENNYIPSPPVYFEPKDRKLKNWRRFYVSSMFVYLVIILRQFPCRIALHPYKVGLAHHQRLCLGSSIFPWHGHLQGPWQLSYYRKAPSPHRIVHLQECCYVTPTVHLLQLSQHHYRYLCLNTRNPPPT